MIKKNLNVEKITTKDPQTGDMVLSYVASTSSEDRYGDIVSQNWNLDGYRQNPIVLLNHNSQELPIGKGDVEIVEDQLLIDITFDMDDPKAAEVARKASAGFLNAVSVGFNPGTMISRADLPSEHFASGEKGNFYESAELLEVSLVTIPANRESTQAAKSFAPFGLPDLEIIRDIIDLRIKKRVHELSIFRHITDVEELEDRYIVTYMKAKDEEEAEQAEEAGQEAEEQTEEEAWKEPEEEEEEKVKSLLPSERDILTYLLKMGKEQ